MSNPDIYNNVINKNSAGLGSGLYCAGLGTKLINNTIVSNDGKVIYLLGPIIMVNNIIFGENASVGVYEGGIVPVILSNNCFNGMQDEQFYYDADDGEYKKTLTDINEMSGAGENILDDPQLENDNMHLKSSSPCIDIGIDPTIYISSLTNDIDGGLRPVNNYYDIGAHEFGAVPPVMKPAEVIVGVYGTLPRPGFDMRYNVIVGNVGDSNANNVTLTNYLPPEVTYKSSSPAGIYDIGSHSVYWDKNNVPEFLNLNGMTSLMFTITAEVSIVPLGTQLVNEAIITTTSPSDDPSNNTNIYVSTVVGAWDPNDKGVSPPGYISTNQLLTYVIHYENEGNWPAYYITIADVLDENLDDNTLFFVSDGGEYDKDTRTITWYFTNVNLPPGGEGAVFFMIRPKSGLPAGTEIGDKATIVFDFNPPIDTPEVVSIIGSPEELSMQTLTMKMYIFKRDMTMVDIPNIQGFLAKLNGAITKVNEGLDYLHNGEKTGAIEMLNTSINKLNALLNFISAQKGKKLSEEIATEWTIRTETLIERINAIIDSIGGESTDSTDSEVPELADQPGDVTVVNNLINPARGEKVTFYYSVTEPSDITIKIYNVRRELVKILVDESGKQPGLHNVDWLGDTISGNVVSSGLYLVLIEINGKREIEKVVVWK